MVLEVLLRQAPAMRFTTTGTRSGGSFFSPLPASVLPQGLSVHHGWYQSVRVADGRFVSAAPRPGSASAGYRQLLCNVDSSSTAYGFF
jgi:hypothetical protein